MNIERELLKALKELEANASQAVNFIPHILLIHAINRAREAIALAEGKVDIELIPEDFGVTPHD